MNKNKVKKFYSLKALLLGVVTLLLLIANDVIWFLRRGHPDIVIGGNRRRMAVMYNLYQNIFDFLNIDVDALKDNDFLLFTVGPLLRGFIVLIVAYALWSIYKRNRNAK